MCLCQHKRLSHCSKLSVSGELYNTASFLMCLDCHLVKPHGLICRDLSGQLQVPVAVGKRKRQKPKLTVEHLKVTLHSLL